MSDKFVPSTQKTHRFLVSAYFVRQRRRGASKWSRNEILDEIASPSPKKPATKATIGLAFSRLNQFANGMRQSDALSESISVQLVMKISGHPDRYSSLH